MSELKNHNAIHPSNTRKFHVIVDRSPRNTRTPPNPLTHCSSLEHETAWIKATQPPSLLSPFERLLTDNILYVFVQPIGLFPSEI